MLSPSQPEPPLHGRSLIFPERRPNLNASALKPFLTISILVPKDALMASDHPDHLFSKLFCVKPTNRSLLISRDEPTIWWASHLI